MHHHIVPQAARHPARHLRIQSLHQGRQDPAHIPAALLRSDLLYQIQESGKTLLHHGRIHLIRHGRRRGSGTGAVYKSKGAVKANPAHHIQGLLKIFFRFSGKAHNNIRGKGNIRYLSPDAFYQGQIRFLIVAPVHGL